MKKCYKSFNFIYKLLKEGRKISIDNDSRIVFISDVHRGDGGNADSLRNNRNIYMCALKYYYKNNYTLIELGDGDELWKNKSFVEIANNYSDVFKLFNKFNEKGRLYMIYGNHDMIKSNPDFIKKVKVKFKQISNGFGSEMIKLYENIKVYEGVVIDYFDTNISIKNKIIAFHGHQTDYMNCNLWYLSRFFVRYIWRNMENIAGFKEPVSPASNYNKGDKIDREMNKISKKENKILICGHTHNDIMPKPGESMYFNDGCCVFPSAVTTLEICNGNISLIKWSVEVNEESFMYVKRTISAGPEEIKSYFK